jgi:hypothetical protein
VGGGLLAVVLTFAVVSHGGSAGEPWSGSETASAGETTVVTVPSLPGFGGGSGDETHKGIHFGRHRR